jgi:hypothetical protein
MGRLLVTGVRLGEQMGAEEISSDPVGRCAMMAGLAFILGWFAGVAFAWGCGCWPRGGV